MAPGFEHLNWERITEVLALVVLIAFFVERALSPLFESRFFVSRYKEKNLKEVLAFLVAIFACWYWDFDAMSMILSKETVTMPGILLTGGIVAGGSKGAVTLFRDYLGIKSSAQSEAEEAKKKKLTAQQPLSAPSSIPDSPG